MSQTNVEIVRWGWNAFIRGDLPELLTIYDPQVVWDTSHLREWPEAAYHGRDGIERFLTEWLDVWADHELEVDEVTAAPDGRVVSLVRQRGTGRISGLPMEMTLAQITTFRDGKVTRIESYEDHDEALRAVGLSS